MSHTMRRTIAVAASLITGIGGASGGRLDDPCVQAALDKIRDRPK